MNFYKWFIIFITFLASCVWIGLFCFWFWLSYEIIPNEQQNTINNLEYDYIIVGGGTAGSVLATRLSENPSVTVLLIEAGSTFGPLSIVPLAATMMQRTNVDWSFKTLAQKYSSKGLHDNQQILPRGKGLGGSSQLNYLLHYTGGEKDFHLWEKYAGNLWSYSNMRYYLNKNEFDNCNSDTNEDFDFLSSSPTETCSANKIFNKDKSVYDFNELSNSKLGDILIEAENELKFINLNDNDFDDDDGDSLDSDKDDIHVKIAKYNVKNGKRFGVYQKYLKPSFNRTNLHIMINTRVHKILFLNDRATFVLISAEHNLNSEKNFVKAKLEIIISAGAYQTPHLLKLSGIGPANELKLHNIDVIYDSPKVGRNLIDHMNYPIYMTIERPESVTKTKILSLTEWWKYLRTGHGILSNLAVVGFITSETYNYGINMFGMGSIDEKALRDVANFKPEVFKSIFPFYKNASQEGFLFLNTCYLPRSRGQVILKSKLSFIPPVINPNYLHHHDDVACIIRAIRTAIKFIKTKAFKKVGVEIHWPRIRGCLNFGPFAKDFVTNFPSDEYLECIMRYGGLTAHHPGGTSAIGNRSDSVLDEYLRVRGVTGLRVVDGSVFPTPIFGTPNSIIVALAERAADIILNKT